MDWYVGTEWQLERKGLAKKVLALDFTRVEKPRMVSKVRIKVEDVANLGERASRCLAPEQLGVVQELEMGSAVTPVDCYLEVLVQEMMVGERASCSIRTKQPQPITFTLTLAKVCDSKELHKLTVSDMYALAGRYKENGVQMFKQYPAFAHDYFARAAKCLMSYKPFDDLTAQRDGVGAADMETLFRQIQTNLAACLLNAKRYEDVIYQTNFVEGQAEPTEKSVYRRAMAYVNMKEFEAAQKTIERLPNYQEKKEFARLHQRLLENWKKSNDQYKHVVQRMFN